MGLKFDLLGDPVPEGRGEAGRTGHIATQENVNKVSRMLVAGLTFDRIARQLGVSAPTLRKHYFQNGKINYRHAREMAIAETRARNLIRLQEQADKGNVSAQKEMIRQADKAELAMLDRAAANPGKHKPAPGKKDLDKVRAQNAETEFERFFQSELPN